MGFGDLTSICTRAPIPPCTMVGAGSSGVEADCYARNIELANTIIFQGATSFLHIIALIMTVFMILHVRSKFTAVGESILLYIENQVEEGMGMGRRQWGNIMKLADIK